MQLAQAFWPGPLTLIVKKQPHVHAILTAGQDTIGLRIPKHPIAQALLQAFGGGIAAPSANKFTRISPTTAAAVYEEFGSNVDVIIDGGPCSVGLESTIIDMTSDTPMIMRPGMISADAIADALGTNVISKCKKTPVILAPGMHYLHYAPRTKSLLIETKDMPVFLENLKTDDLPIAFLTHSELSFPTNSKIKRISMPKAASPFAHVLYHTLRTLDRENFKRIIIEAVPKGMEWDAIRDRIFKATAAQFGT
jgi:L-threonylcarbamoyladenylate synthase